MYREIDVDLYQGIIEESQKKNSRWQITLDTKTAMKILDIDEDVIEGFIKEGNAYEVSYTTLYSNVKARRSVRYFFLGCQSLVFIRAEAK